MQIWVDADACPNVIKDILFRAAERQQIEVILVANQPLRVLRSPFIKTKQVGAGFDVADDYIAQHVAVGDLVITADIPLAAQVIDRQAYALNPRGEFYTPENMRERLRMRNLMEELRSTGAITGGHPSLNQQDRQAFANQLDGFLARYSKTTKR